MDPSTYVLEKEKAGADAVARDQSIGNASGKQCSCSLFSLFHVGRKSLLLSPHLPWECPWNCLRADICVVPLEFSRHMQFCTAETVFIPKCQLIVLHGCS